MYSFARNSKQSGSLPDGDSKYLQSGLLRVSRRQPGKYYNSSLASIPPATAKIPPLKLPETCAADDDDVAADIPEVLVTRAVPGNTVDTGPDEVVAG